MVAIVRSNLIIHWRGIMLVFVCVVPSAPYSIEYNTRIRIHSHSHAKAQHIKGMPYIPNNRSHSTIWHGIEQDKKMRRTNNKERRDRDVVMFHTTGVCFGLI